MQQDGVAVEYLCRRCGTQGLMVVKHRAPAVDGPPVTGEPASGRAAACPRCGEAVLALARGRKNRAATVFSI